MSKASSTFLDRLARLREESEARSAAISEQFQRAQAERTHRAQEQLQAAREQSAKMKKFLAEREKEEEDADPAAKNHWLQRPEAREETFEFGSEEFAVEEESPAPSVDEAPPAPPPVELPDPQTAPTPPPRREPEPAEEFDDDDFSQNSWMVD